MGAYFCHNFIILQNDVLVVSCDILTDLPLHKLVDLHRTHNATLTMLLAKADDIAKSSAPGSKSRKKVGMFFIATNAIY